MSKAAEALQGAIDLLTAFYESPGLAHTKALVLIDKELPVLREALDDVEWTEKGLAEWREIALSHMRQATAARATARIAITHLQAVLSKQQAQEPIGEVRNSSAYFYDGMYTNKTDAPDGTKLYATRPAEQQAADTAARDWLISIGSEPSTTKQEKTA